MSQTPATHTDVARGLFGLVKLPNYEPPEASPFSDVAMSNRHYKEIAWMGEAEIAVGADVSGARLYRPDDAVDRSTLAVLLYRFAERYSGQPLMFFAPPSASPYGDVPVTDENYRQIAWVVSTGIASEWGAPPDCEYRPTELVTSSELGALLKAVPVFPAVASTPGAYASITFDSRPIRTVRPTDEYRPIENELSPRDAETVLSGKPLPESSKASIIDEN